MKTAPLVVPVLLFALSGARAASTAVDPRSADDSLVTRHSSLVTGGNGSASSPYGVCAHLHRMKDEAFRERECFWAAAAGIGRVRFDLEWWRIQPEPGAPFDFSHYDAVLADAERHGLAVLPIIYDLPKWAEPIWEHLPDWEAFVFAVVEHYGDRLPEIEIWNEENIRVFWRHDPDPARYVEALRVAYEAAKRANPRVRVLYGGTAAGVPGEADFVRRTYEQGAARWFDAMNFHPYGQPRAPEGLLDTAIEARRALMSEFGDAAKPIAITEHGWPTHDTRAEGVAILKAGLKIARPEKRSWRVVYAATSAGGSSGGGAALPRAVAEALEDALPAGSTVEACFGARLRERIAARDVDCIVYPFDETYPADTFENVRAFVEAGGVFADLGGMPMWYPVRETAPGVFEIGSQEEKSANRDALKIAVSSWWIDPSLPRETKAFPTAEATAAGYRGDPAGERATRFQTPLLLREGDEFIPLLVAKDSDGRDVAAASVTRLAGGGCVIVSGLYGRGQSETVDEATQARYLVRSLAIALAEGVESYYWYELRANENDPFYSENHFGLMHSNLTPKPAWGAYRNFTLMRPAGSVQLPGPWRDETRGLYFPQWTRPDGTPAGVIWKTGATERMELHFADAARPEAAPPKETALPGESAASTPVFRSFTGRLLRPARGADGTWSVPVGEEPLFFEGARLVTERL